MPLLTIWPKSFVDLVYPSDFASNPILHHARHRYAHEEITLVLPRNPSSHGSVDARLFDDELPMGRLPYSPPTHEFQRYSPAVPTHTSSPYTPHTPDFLATLHRDASEVPMTVSSQSYMSVKVEPSTSCLFTQTNNIITLRENPLRTLIVRPRALFSNVQRPREVHYAYLRHRIKTIDR